MKNLSSKKSKASKKSSKTVDKPRKLSNDLYSQECDVTAIYILGHPNRYSMSYLANKFGVSVFVMNRWRRKYPSFDDAVKKGKSIRQASVKSVISKYNKKMPQRALTHFCDGDSLYAVCGKLGITHRIAEVWREKYTEFNDAVELGLLHQRVWWESLGKDLAQGKVHNGNSAAWTASMKAHFKKDYTEKTETHNVTDITKTIQIEFVNMDEDDD